MVGLAKAHPNNPLIIYCTYCVNGILLTMYIHYTFIIYFIIHGYNIGSSNRGRGTMVLLNLKPCHRNVIFAIEDHFSLAKWPPYF